MSIKKFAGFQPRLDHLFIAHYQKILDEVKEFRDEVEEMYSKCLVDPSLASEKKQELTVLEQELTVLEQELTVLEQELVVLLNQGIKTAIDGEIPSLFDLI